MRKIIVSAIFLIIAVSSYAVDLTVCSLNSNPIEPLPFANVIISIDGSSWITSTNADGKYTFTYSGMNIIPWTSYVTKLGWSWRVPVDGYVTTSILEKVHYHYLLSN
jgi:hypothetical protein